MFSARQPEAVFAPYGHGGPEGFSLSWKERLVRRDGRDIVQGGKEGRVSGTQENGVVLGVCVSGANEVVEKQVQNEEP